MFLFNIILEISLLILYFILQLTKIKSLYFKNFKLFQGIKSKKKGEKQFQI